MKETLKETAEIDLTNLCYYDKRNPDCSVDDEDIEDHKAQLLRVSKKLGYNKTCSCDNCFYGRTELTEQLIWQQERSYSEEYLISFYNFIKEKCDIVNTSGYAETHVKWFIEQFKKK